MEGRYNREHSYGDVKFYLANCLPSEERCRVLMLKVLEQAVRDYCSLAESDIPNEQAIWEEAKSFLFNNDYHFFWGEMELTLEDFLDILDLDIAWVREQTAKKFYKRN